MDSYKGSLKAQEACDIMEKALLERIPNAIVFKHPMADGGEGTVEALVNATKGHIVYHKVQDIFGEEISGYYGVLGDGKWAVIESATASGIENIPKGQLNPMKACSYGTGQLILLALQAGYENIIIGFGGTASSDGGMGALSALGLRFLDEKNKEVWASGENMIKVKSIDTKALYPKLKSANLLFACDVQNPYYGKDGAAYVYAPQKGASKDEVVLLDAGLQNLAQVFKETFNKDISNIPSSGAAGGLSGGLMAITEPNIMSGFDIVAKYSGLEDSIAKSDFVFSGEGKTDSQTVKGKVPFKAGLLAKKYNKPLICISGTISPDAEVLKDYGVTALFSIVSGPMTLRKSIRNTKKLLYRQTINIADLLALL